MTGDATEALLRRSSFLGRFLPAATSRPLGVAQAVDMDPPAVFAEAYIRYATGRTGPSGGRISREEAASRLQHVNAFTDHSTGRIHIDGSRGEPTTLLHEAIHSLSHAAWRGAASAHLNEGATEYFTRLVCAESQLERRSDNYFNEFQSVTRLVQFIGGTGRDVLASAYFQGNITGLIGATNTGDPYRWTNWTIEMMHGCMQAADNLLTRGISLGTAGR